HRSLGKTLQCENIYREGQHIACSFDLTKVKDSSFEQHSVQVMVKDNAGKIRPSYNIVPLTSHEVNNSHAETHDIFYVEEAKCQNTEFKGNLEGTICFMIPGIRSDALNTVRIRVKTNKLCYEDDKLWSNWSQAMSIGQKANLTFYITTLLIIPVIVAAAVIVLLLYLK
ncbi:IL13RA1, partial [Cervus elaphus hippelaphus]